MMQNSQLMNRSVVRYSNALYGISVDKNIQNKIYEESKDLLDIFSKIMTLRICLKAHY